MKQFCKRHYLAASVIAAAIAAFIVIFVWCLAIDGVKGILTFLELLPFWYLPLVFLVFYPFVLTIIEFGLLFVSWRSGALQQPAKTFDLLSLGLGVPYTLLYCNVIRSIEFTTDWNTPLLETLYHTPVHTGSALTIGALILIGFGGYWLLTYRPLSTLPPMVIVLSISAMYLACVIEVVWCVQVMTRFDPFLLLLPLNVVVITARTVRDKVKEWNATERKAEQLNRLDHILFHAGSWPFLAFIVMWPLLGILICVLVLFGQQPNAVIRAFTETSDWNLSLQVAPQSLPYDGHYLCTVAARGHQSLVKPQRKGIRHGHEITVNRQLCIANAFEQILEERTPRFHRHVRHVYDSYGLPIAKLIQSKYASDAVYLLMKPLEWLFLLVLYCAETHPEDRIALQYTGKHPRDFEEERQ